MQSVDFYVLGGTEARERLKFACRIAEKAQLAGQSVLVWLDDDTQLQAFDELLWTFADRSFVPHEVFQTASQWRDTPVLLSCERAPEQSFQLLINLGTEVPPAAALAQRVIEVIDADEERRRGGRTRFRRYRELKLEPQTHDMSRGGDGI
ncbi:MAG: DNA polymerase III subunit chi [Steroidobacterales bacterium]